MEDFYKTMNFGIFYEENKWHVLKLKSALPYTEKILISSCNGKYVSQLPSRNSVYPNVGKINCDGYIKFSYKSLCKACIKKHNLTKDNIDQHIINTKLGVKISD